MRKSWRLASWVLVGVLVGCAHAVAEVGDPSREDVKDARRDGSVDVIAFGDWGANSPAQRQVAKALAAYVKKQEIKPAGAVLCGDNFYVKLQGTTDPYWKSLFEDMYDPKVLDFPFYVSLGNHDYEPHKAPLELRYPQENPDSRWKMPALWYRLDLPKEKPLVTVYMLDSVKDRLTDAQWAEQLRWMDEEMSRPHAAWTMAVAHHPLFSNGRHGDNGVLQSQWGPLFERHKLDFYVCGHDHDLQHLEVKGRHPSFILCGGGGAGTRPMARDDRGPFSRSLHGFVHLNFDKDSAVVKFIGKDGALLHRFEKGPEHTVVSASPRSVDKAEPPKPSTRSTTGPSGSRARRAATQPVNTDD